MWIDRLSGASTLLEQEPVLDEHPFDLRTSLGIPLVGTLNQCAEWYDIRFNPGVVNSLGIPLVGTLNSKSANMDRWS